MDNDEVIRIENLFRRFGRTVALDRVDFSLKRGRVVGLLGVNGAGKTTLIKHVLGLLRAREGTVRVFGHDPARSPEVVLSQVGYLSEDTDLPDWMRVWELMRYTQGMYPKWDVEYAEELRQRFGLRPDERIGNLSKGQRARAGLIAAMAHRPELLILDEPSSGLDPIVRRDILSAIIRTVAEEGRSVLFSSHLIDEVERVADEVVLLAEGRVATSGATEEVLRKHCLSTVSFTEPLTHAPAVEGVFRWDGEGREWSALHGSERGVFDERVTGLGARVIAEQVPSLEEVFVARAGGMS